MCTVNYEFLMTLNELADPYLSWVVPGSKTVDIQFTCEVYCVLISR